MRIRIIGAGPAGLYFALLMKKQNPSHDIVVFERDGPNDTFGWGIVFSDQTFSYLRDNDEPSYAAITRACETWDPVDVVHRDEKVTIRGNRFSGIGRIGFLQILHKRCLELGVDLRFHSNITTLEAIDDGRAYDLLVGADGANSFVRQQSADTFMPSLEVRPNKYIWLGTHQVFDGLTLTFRNDGTGVFAAHSYRFNKTTSTFIVECSQHTWAQAGFNDQSPAETCATLERVFKKDLGGHTLLTNNFVKWFNFVLVKNAVWSHKHVVLLGDALHTVHFSIGSGTKLALEDAIALARCFESRGAVRSALAEFQRIRKPTVDSYQAAAYESLRWFENMHEDMGLEPVPFAYRLMTRSGRIDHEKLRGRDPQFVAAYESIKS